jgi:3-hydroxybutyrate dehydrogenase
MSQKHILITGAGSGIGRGIAIFLAEKGHHIIVTDLDVNAARETVQLINHQAGSAEAHKLNVTSQSDIDSLIANLSLPVDILINNAGVQHVEPLDTFPMEKWEFLIQVLLTGVARLTQAVLPGMKSSGFGRIINVGSIHALVASPYKSAYVAAKHGLLGLSKVLALELADRDITINTLCPAYVRTPLVEKQIAAQAKEHQLTEQQVIEKIMLEPMPKKAFIEIEELAGCCEFLIGPYAKNITAQTIVLDGGWTAR